MIKVNVHDRFAPLCDSCGQRLHQLIFSAVNAVADRIIRFNLALPCGCLSNVEDVTDGEPDRPRAAKRRYRAPTEETL